MIKHTKEEIEKKVNQIWKDGRSENDWRDLPDIHVTFSNHDVQIKLSSMYQAPGLKFSYLMELAEFFGTKNINDDDHFAETGCESCDYGSSYGYVLTIRPE